MSFCTAINCMDGRVQDPVNEFLKKKFDVEYVDVVSEPGPNKILAERAEATLVDSIKKRIDISVHKHKSVGIAIIGHYDCAGNPIDEAGQREHTLTAVEFLAQEYEGLPVIGLWVDEGWKVQSLL